MPKSLTGRREGLSRTTGRDEVPCKEAIFNSSRELRNLDFDTNSPYFKYFPSVFQKQHHVSQTKHIQVRAIGLQLSVWSQKMGHLKSKMSETRAAKPGLFISPLYFQQWFILNSLYIQTFTSGNSLEGPLHSGFTAMKISKLETTCEILHA